MHMPDRVLEKKDHVRLSYLLTSSGLAFPPLYFYNGGIRELFATLKQHVFIIRFSFFGLMVMILNHNNSGSLFHHLLMSKITVGFHHMENQ